MEWTTVTIEKVASVEGHDGPQWEVTVRWPWSNQFPDRVWLDQAEYPHAPLVQRYSAQVDRTGAKRKGDGTAYDGSKPWMWNYRILALEPLRSETSSTVSTASPTDQDSRIQRRVAFEGAIALVCSMLSKLDLASTKREDVLQMVEHWTDALDRLLSGATPLEPTRSVPATTGQSDPLGDLVPQLITLDQFKRYRLMYGWTPSKVKAWLDGLDPMAWVGQDKQRSLRDALLVCLRESGDPAMPLPEDGDVAF